MKQKMSIHWDQEGDFLELRFGKATPSYYEKIGDDIFERRDEKSDVIKGYAIFNLQKRMNKKSLDLTVPLPEMIAA